MLQRKIQNLNDGYIKIYQDKEIESDFSAPVAPKKVSDMEYIATLAYEEMSKRDQDTEFAESIRRKLSLKIKTRLYEKITSSMKAVLNGSIYNILKIDPDKKQELMYLYLEEGRKIAE